MSLIKKKKKKKKKKTKLPLPSPPLLTHQFQSVNASVTWRFTSRTRSETTEGRAMVGFGVVLLFAFTDSFAVKLNRGYQVLEVAFVGFLP